MREPKQLTQVEARVKLAALRAELHKLYRAETRQADRINAIGEQIRRIQEATRE